jgi:hypothetical protein
MFNHCYSSNDTTPLYCNNVIQTLVMCNFGILDPWSTKQHGITMFCKTIKVAMYGIPRTYIFRSLINPTSFVVVSFVIRKL